MTQGWTIHVTPPCAVLTRGVRKLVYNLFRNDADDLPAMRVRTIVYCGSSVSVCPIGHDDENGMEEFTWSNKRFVEKRQ